MQAADVRVTENIKIAKDTYKMTMEWEKSSTMRPGQFVNVQVDGFMLRRPISISLVPDRRHFVIVYKIVGEGTAKLSQVKAGDIINIFGPLGSSYPIHDDTDSILLIGGGVGVPPLLEIARVYKKIRMKTYVVLGFNDGESVFYEEEFKKLGCEVYVATMDGSYGVKGTVMDAIEAADIDSTFVYCCGPVPMLKAVEAKYTKGYMSFESRMACGMGACMACVAKDKKEENMYHRICKEGPVFPIGKVDY